MQTTLRNATTPSIVPTVFLSDLIGDQELKIIAIINYCTMAGLVSFLGTIFNVINIVVFIKLGFKDTINISLLGISIADTGALVTILWGSICQNPLMIQKLESIEMWEIIYLTSSWPHVYFVRVTGWLTSLVTIERYLCIVYPLKVRGLATPKRIFALNTAIFTIMAAFIFPVFASMTLAQKFNLAKNRTVVGLDYSSNAKQIRDIASSFNNIIELSSFSIVACLTVLLVYTLNSKTKWRNSITNATKDKTPPKRDRQVVIMVVFISVNFIICFLPTIIIFITVQFEKRLSLTGRYKNLYKTIGVSVFLLESFSSAVNIFIYLRMSSNYRRAFMSMFKLNKKLF